ncbi:MAG: hypothetical protein ACKO6Q_00620 [Bacteroidota bacterium]
MRSITTLLALLFHLLLQGQNSSQPPLLLPPFIPDTRTVGFTLADQSISVKESTYGGTKQWTFVHLHGSEPTSLQAAEEILPYAGGHLIKLENRSNRNLVLPLQKRKWKIDPNRIYSDTGIRMNLRELNKNKAPEQAVELIRSFGEQLSSLIPDTTACIIALHNNSEENFTIRDYLPGGKRSRDARQVFVDAQQDPDDIVLTTDSLIYAHMAEACFNTIWQDSAKVKRDGSLSVYAALRGRRYVNIETQHGRKEQYLRMLQHLLLFLMREKEIPTAPLTRQ